MKRCAVVVGHSRTSGGAVNVASGTSEYEFNSQLAARICERVFVSTRGVETVRVERGTYALLPRKVNALNPDFAIELHANAFNGIATGTEVLYWHSSVLGLEIANIFQKYITECLKLRDRGAKPCKITDRGGYFLWGVKAPALIIEPFFIDNDADLLAATQRFDALAVAYYNAVNEASVLLTRG